MEPNTDSSLLEELIAAGFERELAEKAILNAPQKTFDAVIGYIERYNKVQEKKKLNRKTNEKQDEDTKKEREEMQSYLRQQELQRQKDEKYLKSLEEKLEAQRIERLNEEKQSSEGEIVKTEEITVGENDCIIKLRMDGGSKVIYVNKNETLAALFEKVGAVIGNKKFEMCDLNHVPIIIEEKTLAESGFYPNKMVLVNRK